MLTFDNYFDEEPYTSRAQGCGESYSIEYQDNTIKTTDAAGYMHTRPRNTRMQRIFTYAWMNISDDTFADLQKFYEQVGTHTTFLFTDYVTEEQYEVRFAEPMKAQYSHPTGWEFTLRFAEV